MGIKRNPFTKEHRERLSVARIGKKLTEENRRILSHAQIGHAVSRQTILKILTNKKKSKDKLVSQYKDGEKIATFKSTVEAGRETGIHYSGISKCCNGTRETAGGFNWKFNNKKENERGMNFDK